MSRPLPAVRPTAPITLGTIVLGVLFLLGLSGCKKNPPPVPVEIQHALRQDVQLDGDLIRGVAANLNRLEEYDEVHMLPQLRERLNQWVRKVDPPVIWQRDPLIADLPADFGRLSIIKDIDQKNYSLDDVYFLQVNIWLRDIGRKARGDAFGDLAVAERLFDWTIRNIQLEAEPKEARTLRHAPRDILLLGRGRAVERAWIFLLLLRQQGIDGVMLATRPRPDQPARFWLPAALIDDDPNGAPSRDDALFLFDTRLGLPIPDSNGQGVATLSRVQADPSLLRQLDLSKSQPYPIAEADLQQITAWIEAGPLYLSRRMKVVQRGLSGKKRVRLSVSASDIAQRLAAVGQLAEVKLWEVPFEIWARQALARTNPKAARAKTQEMAIFTPIVALRKARELHFKGNYDGKTNAKTHYLESRVANKHINALPQEIDLGRLIQISVRQAVFPKEDLLGIEQEFQRRGDPALIDKLSEHYSRTEIDVLLIPGTVRRLLEEAKMDASLWLGIIAYEEEKHDVAVNYLQKRILDAAPDHSRAAAARYNLARVYEATGDLDAAIRLLNSDTSPQRHGNRLRARQLRQEKQAGSADKATEKGT